MDQVTGLRRELAKTIRTRQSFFSVVRRFDSVNVVVVRAAVIWIATQDTFQRRHDLECIFLRLAVERPQMPRPQIHHAFGVESGGVEIVRIVFV